MKSFTVFRYSMVLVFFAATAFSRVGAQTSAAIEPLGTGDLAARALWESFERRFQIVSSSIGMYRATLAPEDRNDPAITARWSDPNFKAQVRLAMEKRMVQHIKSEFSENEIRYLNEIQKYRLMHKYAAFQNKLLEPFGLEVVREVATRTVVLPVSKGK